MIRTGRRVATPSLEPGRSASREEVLEDLSSLTQEQVKMRCKQPLGQRSGLENVAPEVSSPAKLPSPGKLNLSSPNKENEEALNFFQETSQNTFAKRKLMEKEVTEEQMLVEALRTATGQPFAALCGLRKALARPRPPIQGVLRCGGAELLVATLRSTSLSSAGKAEAAWCLVQLASGSSAQTKQLVQAGACTAALEVLQLNSAESSELCDFLLQLLANVGGDVDCGFRDGLLDSDIVNILGHLFAKMPDFTWTSLERCEVLRSFTWLMATLCRGTTAPKLEKVDCAFDFFAQVLQGTADAEMLSSAIWGLCYLLEGAKEMQYVLTQALFILLLGERLSYQNVLLTSSVTAEPEVRPFPKNCHAKVVDLLGKYVVASRLQVNERCIYHGNAEIILFAPITFMQDVRLNGDFVISAQKSFDDPCIHVLGSLEVRGTSSIQGCRSLKGPGAMDVEKHVGVSSNLTFKDCYTDGSAGALRARALRVRKPTAVLSFQNVSSKQSIGAVHVLGSFETRGTVLFDSIRSWGHSGALLVEGKAELESGARVHFSNCTAKRNSGAATITEGLMISTEALMTFEHCRSENNAGALETSGLLQIEGNLSFNNCSTKFDGGCLFMNRKSRLLQGAGFMSFSACVSTSGTGGRVAIAQNGMVQLSGGKMVFNKCEAKQGGGFKMRRGRVLNNGGSIEMTDCHAKVLGGGASISSSEILFDGGSWNFHACTAGQTGGGLESTGKKEKTFRSGALNFINCTADKSGGGFHLHGGAAVIGGARMTFTNCTAKNHGGGLHAEGAAVQQQRGNITFRNCSAQKGGGLFAFEVRQDSGVMNFEGCNAEIQGGGLWSGHGGWSQDGGNLRFTDCFAKETAGGAYSRVGANLTHAEFEECYADGTGAALFLRGAGYLRSVKVTASRADFSVSNILVVDAPLEINSADCTQIEMCRFKGSPVKATKLRCRRGSGLEEMAEHAACQSCDAGAVQLWDGGTSCRPCPKPWELCNTTHFKTLEGFMVSPSNLSKTFFCPNAKACPGGDMPAMSTPMCADGYVGDGCVSCNQATHATADNSVVSCVKCAASDDKIMQVLHILFAVVKDIVLFCVAVAGIRGAAHTKKHSGVFTNQFMSFATVATSSVAAVMQTNVFVQLNSEFRLALQATGVLADLGNGESGGGGAGMAFECLVSYLGFQKTVWNAHIYSCIVPALLMAILARQQDFWLAMVVGTNCFLPGVCADFGKYFVCFRVQREQDGGELQCNFMPPGVPAAVLLALMLLCFVLATVGWTKVAYSKTLPAPKHVLYLSNAYKPEYAAWETERLLRKMCLKLLCAFLPPSLSPSLHMTGASIILLASLGSYLLLSPYKVELWNRSESALLTLALVMTCLSSCLISNELDWGHSELTQRILLFTIAGLAGSVSFGMVLAIGMQMRNESKASDTSVA